MRPAEEVSLLRGEPAEGVSLLGGCPAEGVSLLMEEFSQLGGRPAEGFSLLRKQLAKGGALLRKWSCLKAGMRCYRLQSGSYAPPGAAFSENTHTEWQEGRLSPLLSITFACSWCL